MALRFIDSCGDHYATAAEAAQKWGTLNQYAGTWDIFSVVSSGRTGKCFSIESTGPAGKYTRIAKLLDDQATWIVGFALNINVVNSIDWMFKLYDNNAPGDQILLYFTAARELIVKRGDGTTLATGSTQLLLDTWYYIELKVTIDNTAGSFELRVNGLTEASGSGIDTQNTANASADEIWFAADDDSRYYFDDIYICDGTGSTNNDFLGDVRVEALFPNAAGDYSQWTSSTGSTNYLDVDEADPDDDTSYVYTTGVGNKDLYNMDNLTVIEQSIYGVQTVPYIRKPTTAGTSIVKARVKSGTTEGAGSQHSLSDTYVFYTDIFETNPDTGLAWTISEIDGMQAGVELYS